MLELEVDADGAAKLGGQPRAQGEDLVEGRDGVAAVVGGVGGPQVGHALDGTQGAQLRERQVLDEPAVGPAQVGELGVGGDVGRRGELGVVAGDETPSAVQTRSGSMKSAPIRTASS